MVVFNLAIFATFDNDSRRDVPVGVPLDLASVMEWHELPKYNGIQVSQLIYNDSYSVQVPKTLQKEGIRA